MWCINGLNLLVSNSGAVSFFDLTEHQSLSGDQGSFASSRADDWAFISLYRLSEDSWSGETENEPAEATRSIAARRPYRALCEKEGTLRGACSDPVLGPRVIITGSL
ncbi:hypothetical protein NPIL_34621 [Nephila pilipes]|uniref:Uncharacterized protein n=1 Tax=Nephila pilipes TaxID=299642 RepID=A0A8X6NNM4_NEPPI|nr:hypothetical protein NPIL_34621 [Nephila pilipes]